MTHPGYVLYSVSPGAVATGPESILLWTQGPFWATWQRQPAQGNWKERNGSNGNSNKTYPAPMRKVIG